MKKIKFLLLGIVGLLGFGLTQGQFFDLSDLTGSQVVIPSVWHQSSRSYYNYSLGNSTYLDGYKYYYNNNYENIYACVSDGNIVGFMNYNSNDYKYGDVFSFGQTGNCSFIDLITSSTGNGGINVFNYLYMYSHTSISPYSSRSFGDIVRYVYFDFDKVYTAFGSDYDNGLGVVRKKLFLSVAGNYGSIFVPSNSSGYLFSSLLEDSFDTSNGLNINSYSGYIVLHFNDLSTQYFYETGSMTILLGYNGEDKIAYNIYSGFLTTYDELLNNSPSYYGYLSTGNSISDGYNQFISFINNSDNIIFTNGNILNNSITFTSYGYQFDSQTNLGGGLFTRSSSLSLDLLDDSSVTDFVVGGNGGNQSIGSQPVSSLYYSCLGPTYNTPDGRPPVYCFDSSGNFNADRLLTCFTDYISTGGELQGGLFCNIDGFIQSVVFTGDGSGVSIVSCTSDSCYSPLIVGQSYINLDPVNNVTTGLVLDMITNLTGWVGRCPFPYVDFGFGNSFKVFSYFKSLGYNIDPFVPFNCAIAGFHAGRYTIFEDLDLSIFNTPILNGDTEKHTILFRFFDVLIIFAIFGIFRFFRKHI